MITGAYLATSIDEWEDALRRAKESLRFSKTDEVLAAHYRERTERYERIVTDLKAELSQRYKL